MGGGRHDPLLTAAVVLESTITPEREEALIVLRNRELSTVLAHRANERSSEPNGRSRAELTRKRSAKGDAGLGIVQFALDG